ncbi:MAG: hypothetical protein R3F20_13950 [Planctomycetota bacterium]
MLKPAPHRRSLILSASLRRLTIMSLCALLAGCASTPSEAGADSDGEVQRHPDDREMCWSVVSGAAGIEDAESLPELEVTLEIFSPAQPSSPLFVNDDRRTYQFRLRPGDSLDFVRRALVPYVADYDVELPLAVGGARPIWKTAEVGVRARLVIVPPRQGGAELALAGTVDVSSLSELREFSTSLSNGTRIAVARPEIEQGEWRTDGSLKPQVLSPTTGELKLIKLANGTTVVFRWKFAE